MKTTVEDGVYITIYDNMLEYFKSTRDKWLVSNLINDNDEEEIQIKIAIALEQCAQRHINENHKKRKSDIPNNSNLIFRVLSEVLRKNHKFLISGELSFTNTVVMVDELKTLYADIEKILSTHPRKRKEHTKDKLVELVINEILNYG
jgi:hypothetical protein